VNEAAGDVMDPEAGVSVLERLRAKVKVAAFEKGRGAPGSDDRIMLEAAEAGGDLPIEGLGSGSDYTPFLQHLGISSVNLGFGGEDIEGGIYHSTFDSFDHFLRFGDPKFEYGVALAQTAGRLTLRAADADVLPMRFSDLGDTVWRYVMEIEKQADNEREESAALRKLSDSGAFKEAADPQVTYLPPPALDEVPRLNFAALRESASRLRRSAKAYDDAFARASASNFSLSPSSLAQLNTILQGMEQTLLSKKGLPGRGWYEHMLYAPGLYTGYGAKTIPYVREAVELRHWTDAEEGMPVVVAVLDSASSHLDQATALLATGLRGTAPASSAPKPPPPDN
jgi:N-acetylated-alpha-linked acidic dipeptidase